MSTLEEQIDNLRLQDSEYKKFVPYTSLSELLTEDVIRTTVRSSDIEVFVLEDVIKRVYHGGKRIFAILIAMDQIELIVNFIKHDDFQNVDLDNKLPIGKADLEKIFGMTEIVRRMEDYDTDRNVGGLQKEQEKKTLNKRKVDIGKWVRQFEEKQYEYIVPTFPRKSSHRIVSNLIRLPFIEQKQIGEGGFGVVYKVTLPSQLYGSGSTVSAIYQGLTSLYANCIHCRICP